MLKKGEPLVTLDISETQLAVDKLDQDLAIKENEQARTRLSLEKSLIDLNGQGRGEDAAARVAPFAARA